jgi:phytoene/squalene synthetase
MCLKIFVKGDEDKYNKLFYPARMLGSAFQKVNFLRDLRSDIEERGRIYLPDTHEFNSIDNNRKKQLESETESEFNEALIGIMQLPVGVRLGVYSAYMYYNHLFRKIKMLDIKDLLKSRVRVPNHVKFFLLIKCYWQIRFRTILSNQ